MSLLSIVLLGHLLTIRLGVVLSTVLPDLMVTPPAEFARHNVVVLTSEIVELIFV